jgi:ABC-type polar amino acid transport system ATPase subunit
LVAGLAKLFRELAGDGLALVVVSHDLDFIRQVADRVAVFAEGLIARLGTPAEVL